MSGHVLTSTEYVPDESDAVQVTYCFRVLPKLESWFTALRR
jgi:hypothetical protein